MDGALVDVTGCDLRTDNCRSIGAGATLTMLHRQEHAFWGWFSESTFSLM